MMRVLHVLEIVYHQVKKSNFFMRKIRVLLTMNEIATPTTTAKTIATTTATTQQS